MYTNQVTSAGGGLPPHVVLVEVAHEAMKNNNYLIIDPNSRQAVVVDPAWQLDKLEQTLNHSQVSLSGILITHTHPDHIHLAKIMADKYNVPIWMSEQEIASSGFAAEQLEPIDDSPWTVGQMEITPILTPGHTPGCVCFLIGDNLFTGDVLFAEGCGICFDVPGAHAMFYSLADLKARLHPDTRIYPGHTYVKPPGQKFSDVIKRNMYLQFQDIESFTGYRLRAGQTTKKVLNFRKD
ncbi:MAG: hydroxyacylglutathione hydrolase [Phenylobacterium sp.]|jgi:hydroxyacylglutathione hydrolase